MEEDLNLEVYIGEDDLEVDNPNGEIEDNTYGQDPALAVAPGPAEGAKTLRKPIFTTIDQLRPQTRGHNLTALVISTRTVIDRPSMHLGRTHVAECLIGDSTGTVLVTARNEQGTLACDPLSIYYLGIE